MNKDTQLFDFIGLLYKWRYKIVFSCLLVGIVSAVGSLMLSNYYEASTTFYAASPELANPAPISGAETKRYIYGGDADMERLMTIAESNELKEFLINKFDLFTVYDINPDVKNARHKLYIKLNKLYNVTKSKYDAIILSVEDKDPNLARDMANAARDKISQLAQKIIKDTQQNILESYNSNISEKEKLVHIIKDSLNQLRKKYDITSITTQGETLAELSIKTEGKIEQTKAELAVFKKDASMLDTVKVLSAKLEGYKIQQKTLTKKSNLFQSGSISIENLSKELSSITGHLNIDRERQKQMASVVSSPLTIIHLVERAETPYIKSRPKRSMIVLGSMVLGFFSIILLILVLNLFKSIPWHDIIREDQ